MRSIIAIVSLSILGFTVLGMLAQEGRRRQGVAFLAGWMFPGAGHFVMGKWTKGFFFLGLLGGLWFVGLWIVGFKSVDWDENPFYYVGQFGSGLTMLGARVLCPAKSFPREGLHLSWYDPGLLYVCCAGLLNLVVMLNLIETKAVAPAKPAPVPEKPAA
ncbi:MAG TPA: DUF6677 family protein [Planctomycetota bacterium]